ncbi:ERF family protein [Bergeyella zoohelcum]|uniref:ERF family protein n=1 Tax=Bergeyella zoohelcum TaxID=1015 RepID=UPI003736FC3F
MSIYKKLHLIQSKINGLGKDSKTNQYGYVSGAKVLSTIKPLMNEMGLILKQEVLSIENERMDYKTGIGTPYEKPKSEILSKVMMRFTWIDSETGEKDENLFGANGQNDWEKGLGSALTYAERYFLLKFFHIPTDEDDIDNELRKNIDGENSSKSAPKPTNAGSPEKTIWLNENDANWKKIEGWIAKGKQPTLQQLKDTLKVGISKKTAETLKEKFNIQ